MRAIYFILSLIFLSQQVQASIIDRNPPVDNPAPMPTLLGELQRHIALDKKYNSECCWSAFNYHSLSRTGEVSEDRIAKSIIGELLAASTSEVSIISLQENKDLQQGLLEKGWKPTETSEGIVVSAYFHLRDYGNEKGYYNLENIAVPGTNNRQKVRVYSFEFQISNDYLFSRAEGDVYPSLTLEGETEFYCTEDTKTCWNHGTGTNSNTLRWNYFPNYEGATNSAGGVIKPSAKTLLEE